MNTLSFRHRHPEFLLLIIPFLFGISAVVMLLWNAILPSVITGVQAITYWQAMGIFVLSKILLSGFGRFGGRRGRPHFMNHAMREKLMNMSDEERKQFKKEMREKFANMSNEERQKFCAEWGRD